MTVSITVAQYSSLYYMVHYLWDQRLCMIFYQCQLLPVSIALRTTL